MSKLAPSKRDVAMTGILDVTFIVTDLIFLSPALGSEHVSKRG